MLCDLCDCLWKECVVDVNDVGIVIVILNKKMCKKFLYFLTLTAPSVRPSIGIKNVGRLWKVQKNSSSTEVIAYIADTPYYYTSN